MFKKMKNSKLIGLIISLIPTFLFSQDVMVLKNSDEIKAKVVELTDLIIKYKKWENINGPTYNISKTEVLFIRYENGTKEIISVITNPTSNAVKPVEQDAVELYSTAPTLRKKRMVRLSWDIANANFFDRKITNLGPSMLGYNSRLDIGIRAYEKNNLQIGIQLNPLNLSLNSGSSSFEVAYGFAEQMESQTGEYWYVNTYDDGSDYITAAASFGIYALKNLDLVAVKLGMNVGLITFSDTYLAGNVKNFNGDYLDFVSFVEIDNATYINPSISLLLGETKKKMRWSINCDYKSMWIVSRAGDGWVDGYLNGNWIRENTESTLLGIDRTGIFNIGIGLSGF
jgi:hypothetical protein